MKSFSLKTSKVVATVVGIGLAASLLLGVSVQAASAQGVSLSQLVQLFISLGIIPADKAAAAQAAIANMGSSSTMTTSSSGYTFSTDLTVGSTGADVTALQNALISGGYLSSGLNTGYFGALTEAAVVKWQTANGVPGTGYFGPLSRAKLNGSSSSTTTTTTTTTGTTSVVAGCAPGAMYSSSTGAACTTSTTVTNTGVEGILTANLNSTPSSGTSIYAGDTGDALLGIKLQAQLSPITIERVQLDLGNSSTFYTKFFQNLYLVSDTGQVLGQVALNSNTVTKETSGTGNTYLVTFSGFNYTIPGDNSIHVLTVKGDLYSSIDSTYDGKTTTLTIDSDGIRGTDGAGIDQYAPSTGTIFNTLTLQGSLSDAASLQISTDASNPNAQVIVANSGLSSNESDGVPVLVFDAYAQKDNVQIDDLAGTTTMGATYTNGAYPTTAYLFDGSTQIGSSAVTCSGTGCAFDFTNVNYVVPSNTTRALTVKEDFKNANTTAVTATTAISTGVASEIVAENSVGSTLTTTYVTGSATGNTFTALSQGPVFTLVGTPTITTQQTSLQNNYSTTTAQAVFTVDIRAVGGNIYFGTQTGSSTFEFGAYVNGSEVASSSVGAAAVSFNVPSSGVVTTGVPSGAFIVQQNNEIQLPVTFIFQNRLSTGAFVTTGTYAVGLDGINWTLASSGASKSSTFMNGQTGWRTSTVTLP